MANNFPKSCDPIDLSNTRTVITQGKDSGYETEILQVPVGWGIYNNPNNFWSLIVGRWKIKAKIPE